MTTFCGGSRDSIPSFTLDEIRAPYPKASVLPDTMPTMQNGLATNEFIVQHVQSLVRQGRIPSPTDAARVQSNPMGPPEAKAPLSAYVTKEVELQQNIKEEYCYYERRYFAALDSFLQSVADASLRETKPEVVEPRLGLTRSLNEKLILITQIANQIAKERYASTARFQNEINSLNEKLGERANKLQEQNEILYRETAAADLHKRMVEYTLEKNRANQNLLSLYAVLNVTALAMIFYVART